MTLDDIDKSGLIREAYRIENITGTECRSIFMEWALTLPPAVPYATAIEHLLEAYGADAGHPMTMLLREGQAEAPMPARRGRRRARNAPR